MTNYKPTPEEEQRIRKAAKEFVKNITSLSPTIRNRYINSYRQGRLDELAEGKEREADFLNNRQSDPAKFLADSPNTLQAMLDYAQEEVMAASIRRSHAPVHPIYRGWDSIKLIGRSEERFKQLLHKGWDWSSFYNGWIEGRSDALAIMKEEYEAEEAKSSTQPQNNQPAGKIERWIKVSDRPPLHKAHWITGKYGTHDNDFPVRMNGVYSMANIFDDAQAGSSQPKFMISINSIGNFYADRFHEIEWLNEEIDQPSHVAEENSTPTKEMLHLAFQGGIIAKDELVFSSVAIQAFEKWYDLFLQNKTDLFRAVQPPEDKSKEIERLDNLLKNALETGAFWKDRYDAVIRERNEPRDETKNPQY